MSNFIKNAQIDQVQGRIVANPSVGNAPMTTSFSAVDVIDPS